MRILITALNYAPERIGAGRYTTQVAEHLAGRGHEVRVIAAPPHYPQLRVYEGYSAKRYSYEEIGGVEVFRCPVWNSPRPGAWPRVLRDASFTASAAVQLIGAFRTKPDVVLAVAPSILSAFPAYAAARLYGARSVLHVQDLEIDAAKSLSMLPDWVLKAAISPEGWLMRSFDRVVTISSEMAVQIGDGRGVERVAILRNWADMSRNGHGAACAVRQLYGIDENAVVVHYSGSIGRKQGLETLIRAARLITDRKIVFLVCGEGSGVSDLEQAATSSGNIMLLPLQNETNHRLLLCRADIHLVMQRRGACGAFMPSKLANICSCGGALIWWLISIANFREWPNPPPVWSSMPSPRNSFPALSANLRAIGKGGGKWESRLNGSPGRISTSSPL